MNKSSEKKLYWPTQGWQTVEPDSVGMDAGKLSALEPLINSQFRNINSIVIIKQGLIAFERYFNSFGVFDTHHVASVTKSVISALVGIAIDAGYIKSVDQKVLAFFPEFVPNPDDFQKRTITVRHLLTMTAPIASKSTSRQGNEALDRLRRQRNWVTYILKLLGQGGPLGQFQYSTAGTHLLSAIITRAAGMSARQLANQHLFRPIGMAEIPDHEMKSFQLDDVFGKNVTGWIKDPQGIASGGWGLTITPRDMARFGLLYLARGNWDGNQIISKSWIDQSITPNANNYGYLWWLRQEAGIYAFAAMGSGGSMICCIPEKDLVVAIATKITRNPPDPWQLLDQHIFPALLD